MRLCPSCGRTYKPFVDFCFHEGEPLPMEREMLQMNEAMWRQLKDPFLAQDIEWRVGQVTKKEDKCNLLPYVTSRAIQDRLDRVVGPENWTNEFHPGPAGGVKCRISIFLPGFMTEPGRWVYREDGADNTDIEAVKGGISNAMKRAAVQLGIGRYLYRLPESGWLTIRFDQKPPRDQRVVTVAVGKGRDRRYGWVPVPALPAWALPQNRSEAPPEEPTPEPAPSTVEPLADALPEPEEPKKHYNEGEWSDKKRRAFEDAVTSRLSIGMDEVKRLAYERGHYDIGRMKDEDRKILWRFLAKEYGA